MDKLSEELTKWRADRPDEWIMDVFIREAKKLESLPTCTPNQRAFLDEIWEKGVINDGEPETFIELGEWSQITQPDFTTPLKELVNE